MRHKDIKATSENRGAKSKTSRKLLFNVKYLPNYFAKELNKLSKKFLIHYDMQTT